MYIKYIKIFIAMCLLLLHFATNAQNSSPPPTSKIDIDKVSKEIEAGWKAFREADAIADKKCNVYYDAYELASKKKYNLARNKIKPLAEYGEAEAQSFLGQLHLYPAMANDWKSARHWFSKASQQGDAVSQYWMGHVYSKGLGGVSIDPEMAIYWYSKSSNQGHVPAYTALAYYYREGIGVPKSLEAASILYEKAAIQGDGHAQNRLAIYYFKRHNQKLKRKDVLIDGLKWAILAAEKGNPVPESVLSFYIETLSNKMIVKAFEDSYKFRYDLRMTEQQKRSKLKEHTTSADDVIKDCKLRYLKFHKE